MDPRHLTMTLSEVQERVFGLLLPATSEAEFRAPTEAQLARLEVLRLARAALDLVAGLAETDLWEDFNTYLIAQGEPLGRVVTHWRRVLTLADIAGAFGDSDLICCSSCGTVLQTR